MDLITGGLGFIGNELARKLKQTNNVIILDNKNRIAPRIEDLNDIQTINIDLLDSKKIRETILEYKPERIFHLAAIHYIPDCNANPELTLRVNVEATQTLLKAAAEAGVKHFIFASSGAVYSDSEGKLTENSSIGPVDIYGWSKWFGEELCEWYANSSSLKITMCRLFNNFGPRETNAHIIPEIINQLRNGNELILGNIKPIRDYIHTSDTAKALIKLADAVPEKDRIVNIGRGEGASVEELIDLMGQVLNRDIVVKNDPSRYRKSDKLAQVADISKLQNLTNWSPEIGLKSGVIDLLKFEGFL